MALDVPILKHFRVFYTILLSVDLALYEIFCDKLCDFWQGLCSVLVTIKISRNYGAAEGTIARFLTLKGRFLMFRRYHNFANLFFELSESTFYKEISKFQ